MVNKSIPEPFSERPSLPLLSDINPNTTEKIGKILGDEIISNRDGETRQYLVSWKGKSSAEDTWLDYSESQQIDPDMLVYYKSFSTRDSTSLSPGENDEDMASTCLGGGTITYIGT